MNPLLAPLITAGLDIVKRFVKDPEAQAAAQLEMLKIADGKEARELAAEIEAMKMQASINQEEAKNPSVFVSGWRPAVGWVCVFGLAYEFILNPLLSWASLNFALQAPPSLDMGTLITLLLGLLGLGGMRTLEKLNKVASK